MFDLVADVLVPLNVDLEKVRSELDAQADEYNAEFSIEKVD